MVEQQISVAEVRVRKQREALETGDFSALVPPAVPAETAKSGELRHRCRHSRARSVIPLFEPDTSSTARAPEPEVEPVVTVRDLSGDDDSWDWDSVEALHDSEAA